MIDITLIIEIVLGVIGLLCAFMGYKFIGKNKIQNFITIVDAVVAAANELEITGDLVKLGMTKADYALERAKALLEKNNITFNEDELLVFIKSAVTRLRIEVAGTDAEKIEKQKAV